MTRFSISMRSDLFSMNVPLWNKGSVQQIDILENRKIRNCHVKRYPLDHGCKMQGLSGFQNLQLAPPPQPPVTYRNRTGIASAVRSSNKRRAKFEQKFFFDFFSTFGERTIASRFVTKANWILCCYCNNNTSLT